jgi:hypothetical protein
MNQKKSWTIPFLILFTWSLSTTAKSDEVTITLQSGEVIRGTLISERQKWSLSTYIAPDLSNFENYFVQTRFEWSMKLDIFSGLSLITGLRNDYQSQPASNSNGNDFRGYAGLKLEF